MDISGLKKHLDADQICDEPGILKKYANDWLNLHEGQASLVLFPKTTEQVRNIVLWAIKNQVSLIPSGGRTGLSGGAVALNKEVIVSLEKMNKISNFNKLDKTVEVEAGVITETLQNFAKEKELYFPISFASEGSSQIGGNVATNAGGIHVIRYGSMRENILGLEVVTGTGEVLNLGRGLIKNQVGYSLLNLFIGSEGTLGFITKACIQLTPPPYRPSVFLFSIEDKQALPHVFSSFLSHIQPLAFEFFTDKALGYVLQHSKQPFPLSERKNFYVIMEVEEKDLELSLSLFEKNMENNFIQDGILSETTKQFKDIWSFRENISEACSFKTPYKQDVSVKTSQIISFFEDLELQIEKLFPDIEMIIFGHIGDGNLHINTLKPEAASKQDFLTNCNKINEVIFSLIKKYGGSISAEHGVGLIKKDYMNYSCSKEELFFMKEIKKIFDPYNLLNPGKIFNIKKDPAVKL